MTMAETHEHDNKKAEEVKKKVVDAVKSEQKSGLAEQDPRKTEKKTKASKTVPTYVWDILNYPSLSEKSIVNVERNNKLVFYVQERTNKADIKKAIQDAFNVKVTQVNTMMTHKGKKKAYVTLSADTPALDVATRLGML